MNTAMPETQTYRSMISTEADRLEAGILRERLMAYALQRLTRADAEDVVQQALCEGLASSRLPETTKERTAWLMAIMKNKIADTFRERRHSPLAEAPAMEGLRTTPAGQWEAREVLRDIVAKAHPDEQRTLSWLAKEHAGDALETIAAEERLEAPTLRKRVSRLRQVLRARYLLPAAAVLALLGFALSRTEAPFGPQAITPDTVSLKPATKISEITGNWRIERVEPASNVSASDQTLMLAASRGKLDVTSTSVTLTVAKSHPLRVVDLSDGRLRVRANDGSIHVVTAQLAPDGSLVIEGNEGRFKGKVWLRK